MFTYLQDEYLGSNELKMCLAGTVVASWSLTQEMSGLSPFTVMTNIFVTEFREFRDTFREKLKWVMTKSKSRMIIRDTSYLKIVHSKIVVKMNSLFLDGYLLCEVKTNRYQPLVEVVMENIFYYYCWECIYCQIGSTCRCTAFGYCHNSVSLPEKLLSSLVFNVFSFIELIL